MGGNAQAMPLPSSMPMIVAKMNFASIVFDFDQASGA